MPHKNPLLKYILFGTFIILLLLLCSSASATWYDSNYKYRSLISIDNAYVPTLLKGFPVFVQLNETMIENLTMSNGTDMRFVALDNLTLYPFEIEFINSTKASIWVNVTTVYSATDTIFWMYYNNSKAIFAQDSASVWDNYYTAVFHMNDSSCLWDSTINHYINSSTISKGTNITGRTGNATAFDGTQGYNFSDICDTGTNLFTLEIGWKSTSAFDAQSRRMVGKYDGVPGYSIDGTSNVDREVVGFLGDGINDLFMPYGANTGMDNGSWRYTWMNFMTLKTAQVVTDNIWFAAQASAGNVGDLDNAHEFCIGWWPGQSSAYRFKGYIDEVRMTIGTSRNDTWLNASYYNINNSAFLSLTSKETYSPPPPAIVANLTVYPINEGYVFYEAGGGTYTKYTPWADSIKDLLQVYTPSGNAYMRTFFEWNISHYIPVDAIINSVNFTYWSSNRYWVGGAIEDHDFCFIAKTNLNTTNASSAQSLYDEIYYGPSMSNADMSPTEWFDTNIMFNRSTFNYAGYPVTQEGCWWLPGSASGRSIRDALADNISTSRDRLIMGGYDGKSAPAAGKESSCAISSSINTSAMTRPHLYINCTYNQSTTNGSSFSNSTNHTTQPSVSFNVTNPMSSYISAIVYLYDTVTTNITEEYFIRRASNGTITTILPNAIAFGREYYWWYELVGGATSLVYHFTTEYPFITPPDNLTCHDYSSTTLNFSFNPYNHTNGTTYTVCYYEEGTSAPMYGTGTLGGNVSSTGDFRTWMNITGLTRGTTYTFAFWSFWNDTVHSYSMLSDNATTLTNTTGYGEVTFILRYENTSYDGYNSLINLSSPWFRNSSHRLIIHYANLSDTIYYFNSDVYNASSFSPSVTVVIKYTPLYYELQWNNTYVGGNLTNSYTRVLTKYAEETSTGGNVSVTFYIQTDMHIYGAAYVETNNDLGLGYNTTYTLNEYFEGSIANYLYSLQDYSGYFTGVTSSDNYITIFAYNDSKKLVIDQRFVSADGLISPVLVYGKQYSVGIASTKYPEINTYYEDIGPLVPGQIVAPTIIGITVNPYEQLLLEKLTDNLYWTSNWYPNSTNPTNLYLHITDYSSGITYISFTVYNYTTGSAFYFKSVNNSYDYNFTYTTANHNTTYRLVVNVTYKTVNYSYVINKILYFVPYVHDVTGLENVLIELFGTTPFVGDGSTQSILSYAVMVLCFVFAAMFISGGHPVLGLIIPGLIILGLSGFLSGITLPTAAGGLMVVLGILYAYAQGSIGVER